METEASTGAKYYSKVEKKNNNWSTVKTETTMSYKSLKKTNISKIFLKKW